MGPTLPPMETESQSALGPWQMSQVNSDTGRLEPGLLFSLTNENFKNNYFFL